MSDLPPPPFDPAGGVPTPRPAPPRRPPVVTAAGTILLVAGALAIVGGLVLLNSTGGLALPGLAGREAARIAAVVAFLIGGLDVLAGWLVLRLSPAGRILGIVIAVVGLLGGLAQLRQSGSSGVLSLALYAFVLYGLTAYGFVFKHPPPAR
jgi:hypothetical protein